MQKYPARGAVDGDEQVATRRFVGHLRQVLDVDVNEARLVALEGFFGGTVSVSAFGITSANFDMS
jgi:hypothetical protein